VYNIQAFFLSTVVPTLVGNSKFCALIILLHHQYMQQVFIFVIVIYSPVFKKDDNDSCGQMQPQPINFCLKFYLLCFWAVFRNQTHCTQNYSLKIRSMKMFDTTISIIVLCRIRLRCYNRTVTYCNTKIRKILNS